MKNPKFILLVVCAFSLVGADSPTTAQEPDILIYEGKAHALFSNPLESFFKKHPEKKPRSAYTSTANWRGYVAKFEMVDSTLFVRDMTISDYDDNDRRIDKSVLQEVFPGRDVVPLDWFNGLLTLPGGKLLNYVHMGYGSTFEFYTMLEIRDGNLTRVKTFNHEEYTKFRERQFELFKQTAEYKETISMLKKESRYSDDRLESFMKVFGIDYLTHFIDE